MPLKKVLTLRTVVATSAGITLATSSFAAAAQVAGFLAGNSAWLAILVCGFLCLLAAACFSELNGILPSAAGIRLYLGRAFGEKIALTFSLLYMVLIVVVVGAESFILSQTLSYSVPQVAPVIWITIMLAAVALMNIRGVKVAGAFQDIVTYGVVISTVLISLWALHAAHWHLTAPLATGGASNFIEAVAVGVFLFIGFEWVTPLAEEVTESRLIAHGMFITVGIVCVVYALFTAALTANVPRTAFLHLSQISSLANVSPITQVLLSQKVLGELGLVWILLVSVSCSFGTFNAGMLGASRFFYATAREHALPPVFSRISMKYMTPWVATIAVFVVGYASSLAILYTHQYLVVMNMGAATECLIYVLSAAALMVLRKKMADAPRAFKIPFGPVIPVFTILIFMFLAVVTIATSPAVGIWMAAVLAVIALYVFVAVPRIKEKYKVRRAPGTRRRPAAGSANGRPKAAMPAPGRVSQLPDEYPEPAGLAGGGVPALEKGGDKA
jgi:amino acid transporter